MKTFCYFLLLSLLLTACQDSKNDAPLPVEPGVSIELAEYRKAALSELTYELFFDLPQDREAPISAKVVISFNYHPEENKGLQLDFKEEGDKLQKLRINGKESEIHFENEHLVLASDQLQIGENSLELDFIAGNSALNRRSEFLYTLFVPDRARTAFPVFDQPDLKAVFKLSLRIPKTWKAIANGKLAKTEAEDGHQTLYFEPTEMLPTYLFSFAAGEFEVATEAFGDGEIELFYRETDPEKIEESLPRIFEQYKEYVAFYEEWTKVDYPFQKHGMVAIPEFQFGGMEHPGAILLQSSTLFLPEKATQSQLNTRAHLLAHEVAHMWFGDLVTMKWFNDVWTKEVFANFISDKATSYRESPANYALKFLTDHFPMAYAVDRTPGANPIRQQLENLQDAGTMYGNIIYHKAPIMMQQLEKIMGKEAFQKGIQIYLQEFAYDNATWPDLIAILDKHTSADLYTWNEVWVNDPGRPIYDWVKEEESDHYTLIQKPERGEERFWPQSFDIALYDGYKEVSRTEFTDSLAKQPITELTPKDKESFLQINPGGQGYGVMPIDPLMLKKLFLIEDKVARASAYINLYENTLNQRYLEPSELFDVLLDGVDKETEELNLKLLIHYISQLYWVFMEEEEREARTEKSEEKLWASLYQQKDRNNQKLLFKAYSDLFRSEKATDRLFVVWESENPPVNVHLTVEDYTDLAFALQLRKDYPDLLDRQYQRITNPDRQERFEIIRPALSFDQQVKDEFFKALEQPENRAQEASVLTALSYLHHPLNHPESEKYLQKSLELIPEIQKTGDIFFPGRWLGAIFGKYRSEAAYQIVEDYLNKQTDLNPKLKEKILQETDNLRRVQEF